MEPKKIHYGNQAVVLGHPGASLEIRNPSAEELFRWSLEGSPADRGTLQRFLAFGATKPACYAFPWTKRSHSMRGVILWLIGVPISIIILLYLFGIL